MSPLYVLTQLWPFCASFTGKQNPRVCVVLCSLCCLNSLSTCGDILGTLAVSLARLCLSVVVLARQKSARCSEAVEACSVATSRLMKVSRRLLVSVLELFGTNITSEYGQRVQCKPSKQGIFLYMSNISTCHVHSCIHVCTCTLYVKIHSYSTYYMYTCMWD